MKILVFGCGDWCARYLESIKHETKNITGFLDNDESLWGAKLYGVACVFPPDRIREMRYDKIIVCSNSTELARKQITAQLCGYGADAGRIEFFPEIRRGTDCLPRMLFFKNFARYLDENRIEGDVAECGVWQGQTAAYMNRYFKNRRLFLFDTFEGYPEGDLTKDSAADAGFNRQIYNKVSAEPTLDTVMSKMTFPANVVVRKGYFPETMADISARFSFVHVDFTLYEPERAALDLFYDNLPPGGAMLFNTYYSSFISCTRKAVDDFERKRGRRLIKMPIADTAGALIIKE
jgi:hypothetical protein